MPICDLDASTDGTSVCPSGCLYVPASVPTCDLDASTDGSSICPDGCTFVDAWTPTCDLSDSTDGSGECPSGCVYVNATEPEVYEACEQNWADHDDDVMTPCVQCAAGYVSDPGSVGP